MSSVSIQDWYGYLSATASAAATLTGLVFVAVSINLGRILQVPGLPGLAVQSLVQLLGVLFVSLTALVPWQPSIALGIEILSIDLGLWLIQSLQQISYLRSKSGHPIRWAISRIVWTQCACLPFCIAGVFFLRNSAAGSYWLAAGFIFSFCAGVANAWVLLVEILR